MTTALTKQKADEEAHHEMCVDDLNENQLSTEEKKGLQTSSADKIQMLKVRIKSKHRFNRGPQVSSLNGPNHKLDCVYPKPPPQPPNPTQPHRGPHSPRF